MKLLSINVTAVNCFFCKSWIDFPSRLTVPVLVAFISTFLSFSLPHSLPLVVFQVLFQCAALV